MIMEVAQRGSLKALWVWIRAFLLTDGIFDTKSGSNFSLTTSGSFVMNGGTFLARASTITVGGTFSITAGTFNAGTSTVYMNGTGASTTIRSYL